MKCRKCGIELSDKVCKIHESRCEGVKDAVQVKEKKEEKEQKIDWRKLGIDAGLKGEDLKKFMKKNAKNKQIQLDKLKD